jgi:hypothetical protein
VLGDKTRSRGTPLPVAIVRQPAANFIRKHFHMRTHMLSAALITAAQTTQTPPSPGFYIDEAREGGNPKISFSLAACIPDFPLPLHPFPPKAQLFTDRRDHAAVEI